MLVIGHDYGHGGTDTGTTAGGMLEKDVQLMLGLMTSDRLEQRYNVKVIRTRITDKTVSLEERVNILHANRVACFQSFHHNASGNGGPGPSGFEIYIYGPQSWLPAVSPDGKVNHQAPRSYARALKLEEKLKPFVESWGMKWNGIKTGNFYVLRNFNGEGVLFEAGYASNPNDAALLKNPHFLNALADAYVEAIAYAWELEPKVRPKQWGDTEHEYLLEKGLLNTPIPDLDKPVTYRWAVTVIARLLSKILNDGRF